MTQIPDTDDTNLALDMISLDRRKTTRTRFIILNCLTSTELDKNRHIAE